MSHLITLRPSGLRFQAGPGETVLEAALRHQLAFPFGCRGGACGACKGKLIAGEIDYGGKDPIALSEAERRHGLALFCLAQPCGDLELEIKQLGAAPDIPIKTLPCRVARLERLADEVMRLYLKLPQHQEFRFLPGQYIDILLRDGRRRSFSLANTPGSNEGLLELHIRHIEGGFFTTQVFERMREKDLLRLEGPLGNFFLRDDSERPLLFVAGGTGFAPIKAMLEQCFNDGLERPVYFYWGARSPALLYLDEQVRQWQRRNANLHYTPVISGPNPLPGQRQGWVHEAVCEDFGDLSPFDVYASGPPEMVDAVRRAFLTRGMNAERYFCDAFTFSNS